MTVLSIKLASELKEAGLVWSPEAGDWFATRLRPTWWLKSKKGGAEELHLLTGQPTENGYYGWSIVDTEPFCELFAHDGTRQEDSWGHLERNFTWLPRVDQISREICRRARSFHIVYKNAGEDPEGRTGYWVSYAPGHAEGKEEEPREDFFSESLDEAMGSALLALLKKERQSG